MTEMAITPTELLKAVEVFGLPRRGVAPADTMIQASLHEAELAQVLNGLWSCFCDALRGFIYASVPITSGRREIRLMNKLHCDRETLRVKHKRARFELIIRPNELSAARFSAKLAQLFVPSWAIMNPAAVGVVDWSQSSYMSLWLESIHRFATAIAITPGWAYSSGSRQELDLAISLGLPVFDFLGRLQSLATLTTADSRARATLRREGWDKEAIDSYLSPIRFESRPFQSIPDRHL